MITITTNQRNLIGGMLLAIFVATTLVIALERPGFNTTNTDGSNPWNFNTGLSLSGGITERSTNLVSFGVGVEKVVEIYESGIVAMQSIGYFSQGLSGLGGDFVPETIPSIVDLHQPIGEYEMRVTSLQPLTGKLFNTTASPNLLSPLSLGLASVLETNNVLEEIDDIEYNSFMSETVEIDQITFSISHLYSDGSYIRISIFDNHVLISYDIMDFLEFTSESAGILKYPERMGIDNRSFYHLEMEDFDQDTYILAVNQVISDLFGGF